MDIFTMPNQTPAPAPASTPIQTPVPTPAVKGMKVETKALIAFIIAGILVGIASWAIVKIVQSNAGPFVALGLTIIVLVAIPKLLQKRFGVTQKMMWWMNSGGWIYLFVWFIVWIIFYNIA